MKTAKEMFEAVGMFKTYEDETSLYYEKPTKNYDKVVFDKGTKTYYSYSIASIFEISIHTHLAITQQMKELGWIE